MSKLRPIAIYLPQFHPTAENDAWWGKGFTEWTNVTKAKPVFKGHYQPHLPTDLGFYDLRLAEAREAQAALAKQYGIYGFCYYHYWFNGKRILDLPINEVMKTGKPDFPFMFCWANENWTMGWKGDPDTILVKQNYSDEDDLKHIQHLIPYFLDKRYIRINNKPVFAVYRSINQPNAKRTIEIWRNEAAKHGLELYICRFDYKTMEQTGANDEDGFDAAVNFEPGSKNLKQYLFEKNNSPILKRLHTLADKLKHSYNSDWLKNKLKDKFRILDYEQYVNYIIKNNTNRPQTFPGVMPSWDNVPRYSKKFFLFKNASPFIYRKWLDFEIKRFTPPNKDENLFFINAWNEWAEGNHLEPCIKWGTEYLEQTKQAFESNDAK